MSTLKINEEVKNELEKNVTTANDHELWENEQLDIFSDIIISILLKSNVKIIKDEK